MSGALGTIIYLAVLVAVIAGIWKMFTKAGEPGWASIIPIYNTIVMLRIAGRPVWWFILFLIPFVNVVTFLIVAIDLARSFGKGTGFGIGIFFLSFIFLPVLGFGDAQYIGPGGRSTGTPTLAGTFS